MNEQSKSSKSSGDKSKLSKKEKKKMKKAAKKEKKARKKAKKLEKKAKKEKKGKKSKSKKKKEVSDSSSDSSSDSDTDPEDAALDGLIRQSMQADFLLPDGDGTIPRPKEGARKAYETAFGLSDASFVLAKQRDDETLRLKIKDLKAEHSKKRRAYDQNNEDTSRDWICDKCNFRNFANREKCNKCNRERAFAESAQKIGTFLDSAPKQKLPGLKALAKK